MKRFLPNLLILFSLILCGLIAFQWVREAKVRAELKGLKDDLHSKMESVQALEGSVKDRNTEISRLEALRKDLEETAKSNRLEIVSILKKADKFEQDADGLRIQVQSYKDAVTTANDRLRKQNDDIVRQNADIRKLIADRGAILTNYNELAAKHADLVKQWNQQQQEIAKANEAQAAAAAAAAAAAEEQQKKKK